MKKRNRIVLAREGYKGFRRLEGRRKEECSNLWENKRFPRDRQIGSAKTLRK